MLIWAITVTVLFFVSIFVIVNVLRKYEKLEEDVDKYYKTTEQNNKLLTETVLLVDREIHEIDRRGSFEADDEVGTFFKRVKELRDLLKDYIPQ